MPNEKMVRIFIASSSELKDEREKCILLVNQLNKSHKHLDLEPVEWEFDMTSGSVPGYATIQKNINPLLEQSDMALFMFYSKLGQYTKEEFELAMQEKKKLFAYFKRGFSPKKDTYAAYGDLLTFKDSLNDTVLYQEYEDLIEFEKLLFPALNLYLAETYPLVIAPAQEVKLSDNVTTLIQMLAAKEDEIKTLKNANKVLPAPENSESLQQLIKAKEDLQQQLMQMKEIQDKQAKDKAALEQQLSLQIEQNNLKKKALDEIGLGNYGKAESYLKESARESIKATAATYYELAKIKKLQLQYKDAFSYYELAVRIYEEDSMYLNDAGTMADELGFYDKAISYYDKALLIDKKNGAAENAEAADKYNNLGLAYKNKGEYAKAISYFEKALVIYKKIYGKAHPYIAVCYINLGTTYNNIEDYDKAIDCFENTLKITNKDDEEDNLNLANCYSGLGATYDHKKQYTKAISYYQKALAIDKKYYGEEHPNISNGYYNLGATYNNKGDYNKAIEYYDKALAIDKKYYGEEHPAIAQDYNNFGSAYTDKKEYAKALDYYEKALKIYKQYYGEDHPDIATCYYSLGVIYHNKEEYKKAVSYFEKALTMYQKFFPPAHSNIKDTQEWLQLARQSLKGK